MTIKDFDEMPNIRFEDGVHEYWKKPHTSWLSRNIMKLWIFAILLQFIFLVITTITFIITNVNLMYLTHIAGVVVGGIMIVAAYVEKYRYTYYRLHYIVGGILVLVNVIMLLYFLL